MSQNCFPPRRKMRQRKFIGLIQNKHRTLYKLCTTVTRNKSFHVARQTEQHTIGNPRDNTLKFKIDLFEKKVMNYWVNIQLFSVTHFLLFYKNLVFSRFVHCNLPESTMSIYVEIKFAIQIIPHNSLFVARRTKPIASIDTEVILSS